MHFEDAIVKYIVLANKCADPKFLDALRLMKSEVVGKETFEIFLDPKTMVNITKTYNKHMKYF